MKYLVWHITHGVQVSLDADYAVKHIGLVREYIPISYWDYIRPVFTNWSALVEERQKRTWRMESELSLSKLRRVSVNVACDLLWYDVGWINDAIHAAHEMDLKLELEHMAGKAELGGVVRQGHSLGSQIMLDASHRSPYKSIGLITLGSPITKYSGKFKDWGSVPPGLNAWLNIYAARDLVSSGFHDHPRQDFRDLITDEKIFSWNPLNQLLFRAHTFYWKDRAVCKLIGTFLTKRLMEINA